MFFSVGPPATCAFGIRSRAWRRTLAAAAAAAATGAALVTATAAVAVGSSGLAAAPSQPETPNLITWMPLKEGMLCCSCSSSNSSSSRRTSSSRGAGCSWRRRCRKEPASFLNNLICCCCCCCCYPMVGVHTPLRRLWARRAQQQRLPVKEKLLYLYQQKNFC